jgi:hypothetical protein
MTAYDADLVEINPLAIINEGQPDGSDATPRLPRRQDHPRRLRAAATPGLEDAPGP